jgi:hypothetical protein
MAPIASKYTKEKKANKIPKLFHVQVLQNLRNFWKNAGRRTNHGGHTANPLCGCMRSWSQ